MANHSGIRHVGAQSNLALGVTDEQAFFRIRCGFCGTSTSAAVIAVTHTSQPVEVYWLRCTNCQQGSVISGSAQYPGSMPGDDLEGLPAEVAAGYAEARRCFAVNAYTGSELLCRKLLMYVAVDAASAKEGDKFAAYVDALEKAGYITPPMKTWVDRIRDNANESTHELPSPSRDRALMTLNFTMQLLRIVYEMPHQANATSATP